MRKRFFWSVVFSVLVLGILLPVNILLLLNIKTPLEQARANFITIMIVEATLIFGVVFAVINQYFNLHTDYETLVFSHKKQHPEVPITYYKNNDMNVNRAVDEADKKLRAETDDNDIDDDNSNKEEDDNDDDDCNNNNNNKTNKNNDTKDSAS